MTRERVIRLSVSLVACGIFVPPLVTGLATVVPIVVAVTLGGVLAMIGVVLLASRLASSSREFLQHRRPFAGQRRCHRRPDQDHRPPKCRGWPVSYAGPAVAV